MTGMADGGDLRESQATIHPGRVEGRVRAPPSKSATHRLLLLAAQSSRPCIVQDALDADDTRATLAALVALGAKPQVEAPRQDDGTAPRDSRFAALWFEPAHLAPPAAPLDCRNAGTTMRLLAATVARFAAPVHLTGDASLRRRPNGPLLDALCALGASVSSDDGRAPLRIRGPIHPGVVALPAQVSSQFASALLLSLPMLEGPSDLLLAAPQASTPYLELTLAAMREAGLRMDEDRGAVRRIRVPGGQSPRLGVARVEGDWSSAAFPLAAAAVTGGHAAVEGLRLDSVQGDRAILDHLEAFGCTVRRDPGAGACVVEGPQRPQRLRSPGAIDVGATPDLFPVLAAVAACAAGTTTFAGGALLRGKESDRIRAMAEGITALGGRCRETADGLVVHGTGLHGGAARSHGDHRIHMALVVAGLGATGTSFVDGAASVDVSYPGFHDGLRHLGAGLLLGKAGVHAAEAAAGVPGIAGGHVA